MPQVPGRQGKQGLETTYRKIKIVYSDVGETVI